MSPRINKQNNKYSNRSGGIGVYFGLNDPRNISLSLVEDDNNKVTNQVTELLACVLGIETELIFEVAAANISVFVAVSERSKRPLNKGL